MNFIPDIKLDNKSQNNIPNHWEWVTINDIGIVTSGGTPSTKEPEFWNGDIPWVTPADLSNYEDVYISKGKRNISQVGLEYSSATLLPENSIIFSSRAPIGYVAITKNELATNQGFKNLILPSNLINPKYVYYYLKTVKELAENMASGTTFLELSASNFKQIPFPLAPIEEQNSIVDKIEEIYSSINELIKEIKKKLNLIPAYKQLIIKKNIKNIGKQASLGNLANFIDYRGRTPTKTKNGIRLITAKNIKNGYVSFEPEEFISKDKYDEWMTRGIPKMGDIFITTEAPLGNVAEYNFDDKIALAQRVITLQPKEQINGTYLKYYLMSSEFQERLISMATGTTVNGIKSRTLKRMIVYYPDKEEQIEIVKELDRLNSLSNNLEKELSENLNKAEALKLKILMEAFQGTLANQIRSSQSKEILLEEIKKVKKNYLNEQQETNKNRPKVERKKINLLNNIQNIFKSEKFDFQELSSKVIISQTELEKEFDSLINNNQLEKVFDKESKSIKYKLI